MTVKMSATEGGTHEIRSVCSLSSKSSRLSKHSIRSATCLATVEVPGASNAQKEIDVKVEKAQLKVVETFREATVEAFQQEKEATLAEATPHTLRCCWQFMASIKPQLFNQRRKLKDLFRISMSTWTSHQHTATTRNLNEDMSPPTTIKTSLVVAKPTLAVKNVYPGETEQLSLYAPTSTETISSQVCWFFSR